MAKSRLVGSYPVIGIRPTIDGRRGALDVRGSLEDQTMNMAKSAAKLFEENLKYSNGEPVKVVIADTTIGRVGESAACADKFRKEGVDITLTVTPCWCYGAETMDMDPQTIKAVWGFNGTERPGAVYLASVLATHAQKGLPAFGIYGHEVLDADDTVMPEDVKEVVLKLGSNMLKLAGISKNIEECKKLILQNIQNGNAYEKFIELVENQGGDIEYIKDTNKFEKAKYIMPVTADKDFKISEINAGKIGNLCVELGAGRMRKEDNIDYSAGIVLNKKVGEKVKKNDILAYVHSNNEEKCKNSIDEMKKIII